MKTIKRVGYYLNNIVNVFLFLFFFSGIEVKRISISCFLYPLFLRCESFLRTTEYKTIKFVQKGASANSGTGRRLNFADNKRPAGEWDEKKNMCIITLANSRRFFLFFFFKRCYCNKRSRKYDYLPATTYPPFLYFNNSAGALHEP